MNNPLDIEDLSEQQQIMLHYLRQVNVADQADDNTVKTSKKDGEAGISLEESKQLI